MQHKHEEKKLRIQSECFRERNNDQQNEAGVEGSNPIKITFENKGKVGGRKFNARIKFSINVLGIGNHIAINVM